MSQAFAALWASIVRTVVPIIVGAVLGFFASTSIPLDPEFEGLLNTVLTLLLTTAYYVAVRLFETYVSPKIGWLLGWAKSPDSYSAGNASDLQVSKSGIYHVVTEQDPDPNGQQE
ncbi:hypothetical protein [Glutamicibacter sp. 2E12]|uniref:hypothetical protein n=1 Tax=Glutamicibacter sp. 2E12 TaxID=3416181 RepID=UPI003CF10F95